MYGVAGLVTLEHLCSDYDVDSLVVAVRLRVEGQTFWGAHPQRLLDSSPIPVSSRVNRQASSLWESSSTTPF